MTGLKLALPKGRLLGQTRALLERAELGLGGYSENSRHYRLASSCLANMGATVFQERDVPIQVAIGNYDLGICGCQWLEELVRGYPQVGLVRVAELGYGKGTVFAAVSAFSDYKSSQDLAGRKDLLRIVSEYPNIATSVAVRLRLRRFQVFPLWGRAEVYLPENSDLAVLWREPGTGIYAEGLTPLFEVLTGGACLVANKTSWEGRDLEVVVGRMCQAVRLAQENSASLVGSMPANIRRAPVGNPGEFIWLALPDGHQQTHASKFLENAGINVEGYSANTQNCYPAVSLSGVKVKIVRPQDMPMQVANGNFDLAVTGRDWLEDHKCRFPSSPVEVLLDLDFGRVRIVAAMDGAEPVENIPQLKQWMRTRGGALRVASEYVNLADRFAREHHLVPYKVIPTWGATEAFIPEDADLLIENTETGRTLAEHNLRVIDNLAASSACLIGNTNALNSPGRRAGIVGVVDAMRRGLA